MSRPKTVRSKTKSRSPHPEAKGSTEPTPAAKSATPESTPDQNAKAEHRAESDKGAPTVEQPWSDWFWYEEGQTCYRGRKDTKGEWEYDFAPLPPKPKERPYTPPREEPIEYLIDELKIIWEPRPIDVHGAAEKVKAPSEGEKKKESKEGKALKEDEEDSNVVALENQHDKAEKSKREKHTVKRGRPLERPERRHPSHKERKEKVEGWRKGLE